MISTDNENYLMTNVEVKRNVYALQLIRIVHTPNVLLINVQYKEINVRNFFEFLTLFLKSSLHTVIPLF